MDLVPGAAGYRISNPPVLLMCPLLASLDVNLSFFWIYFYAMLNSFGYRFSIKLQWKTCEKNLFYLLVIWSTY